MLQEFWESQPRAAAPLQAWHQIVRHAGWASFAELRQTFPSADQVGRLTVFNIGGNKFRLIARIEYTLQRVYVRRILTHKEYDKGEWKEDPWL